MSEPLPPGHLGNVLPLRVILEGPKPATASSEATHMGCAQTWQLQGGQSQQCVTCGTRPGTNSKLLEATGYPRPQCFEARSNGTPPAVRHWAVLGKVRQQGGSRSC